MARPHAVQIHAKNLVLGLLLAADGQALGAAQLIAACRLFGVTDNSVRVTLTRLAAEGKVESAGRGVYRLGRAAQRLGDEVGAWRDSATRVTSWNGDFLAAFTANLGRRDRTQLRRRERALDMLGFRELERGLHVRPNNLRRGADGVRARLSALGLDSECELFCMSGLSDAASKRVECLWDGARLNAHYVEGRRELETWTAHHDCLEPDVAARESYLLGSRAIRSVVFDPWLPEPFVDVEARRAFFETVCRFDDLGKGIWRAFAAQFAPRSVGASTTTSAPH